MDNKVAVGGIEMNGMEMNKGDGARSATIEKVQRVSCQLDGKSQLTCAVHGKFG